MVLIEFQPKTYRHNNKSNVGFRECKRFRTWTAKALDARCAIGFKVDTRQVAGLPQGKRFIRAGSSVVC